MSIRRFLLPSLSMIVLACVATVANAQTGPIGGGSKTGKAASQPAAGGELTPETIAKLLQVKGAKTQILAGTNNSTTVRAVLEAGGWRYDIDATFVVYNNGTKGWFLSSRLVGGASSFTQAQMAALLKKNFDLNGSGIFGIDALSGDLYLETPHFATNLSDQWFYTILDAHTSRIRTSVDLWNVNK